MMREKLTCVLDPLYVLTIFMPDTDFLTSVKQCFLVTLWDYLRRLLISRTQYLTQTPSWTRTLFWVTLLVHSQLAPNQEGMVERMGVGKKSARILASRKWGERGIQGRRDTLILQVTLSVTHLFQSGLTLQQSQV